MVKNEEAELSLHLFKVLSRTYQSVIQHSIQVSKKYGFNPTEFAVLELLYHKGPQPLQVIGSHLFMVSGGVTYVVDKLEKSGLLYRQPCNKDRRVIFATLTEEGKRLMADLFPKYRASICNALHGVNTVEKKELIDLLKKVGLKAEERLHMMRNDKSETKSRN